MANEEIIKGLESVKSKCASHFDAGYVWVCSPIEEAIEALKREPSTDAVSREYLLSKAYAYGNGLEPDGYCVEVEDIQNAPPVTPERPKGEWKYTDEVHEIARCSKCNFLIDASGCIDPEEYISIYKYCPNCGADMREVKE